LWRDCMIIAPFVGGQISFVLKSYIVHTRTGISYRNNQIELSQRVSRTLLVPNCHACPVVRPALWQASTTSTIWADYTWLSGRDALPSSALASSEAIGGIFARISWTPLLNIVGLAVVCLYRTPADQYCRVGNVLNLSRNCPGPFCSQSRRSLLC
jgi:hypothetical protein